MTNMKNLFNFTGGETNKTRRDFPSTCFLPTQEPNCSQSYILQAEMDINDLRWDRFVMVMIVYFVCILNNTTSLYVFSQTRYSDKLLIRVLRFFYIGNIVHVSLAELYLLAFSTDRFGLGSSLRPLCTVWWYLSRVALTFLHWTLASVNMYRMLFIVNPRKYKKFQKNTRNMLIIVGTNLELAVIIVMPSLLTESPSLRLCDLEVEGSTICHVTGEEWADRIGTYSVPFLISIVSHVVLIISKYKKRRADANPESLLHMVDQVLLISTVLMILSTLPLAFHNKRYGSDMIVTCNEDYKKRFVMLMATYTLKLLGFSMDCTLYILLCPRFRESFMHAMSKFRGTPSPAPDAVDGSDSDDVVSSSML